MGKAPTDCDPSTTNLAPTSLHLALAEALLVLARKEEARVAAREAASFADNRRQLAEVAREKRIPFASHDDARQEHIDEAVRDLIRIGYDNVVAYVDAQTLDRYFDDG